jgi:hypothetical protein
MQRIGAQVGEFNASLGRAGAIEAADLDAALEWAGRASAACERPVEVRPTEDA